MRRVFWIFLWVLLATAPLTGLAGSDAVGVSSRISQWEVDSSYLYGQVSLSWGNDPFLKKPGFVQVDSQGAPLALQGIVSENGQNEAVISGMNVILGDVIGHKTIAKIGSNYVLLADGDSLQELSLPYVTEMPVKAKVKTGKKIARDPASKIDFEQIPEITIEEVGQ